METEFCKGWLQNTFRVLHSAEKKLRVDPIKTNARCEDSQRA
eukprot:SAG31_NODE_10475_length_1134_cov_1.114976_2_plen_41_part_01